MTGKGLTRQSYALREKILEVDRYLAQSSTPIIEVHPELAFTQMNGSPVPSSKKTWEGHTRRRELLRRHNIELPDDLGEPGRRAASDDVLDAAAAAWVALHHENGNTISLPNPPEPMSLQGTAAMWICARLG